MLSCYLLLFFLIYCNQFHYHFIHGYQTSSLPSSFPSFNKWNRKSSRTRQRGIIVLQETINNNNNNNNNKLDFARGGEDDRKTRWKQISYYERKAIELLSQSSQNNPTTASSAAAAAGGGGANQLNHIDEAIKLFAKSQQLKNEDPYISLTQQYLLAVEKKDVEEAEKILKAIKSIGFPPHIQSLIKNRAEATTATTAAATATTKAAVTPAEPVVEEEEDEDYGVIAPEDVDPSSNFSDTVTENIRVKVTSFYDLGKSDPKAGKYMFWYKVAIYNEGNEPVQIVARMWEIENFKGEKETVRGAGVMHTQPIIPPGELFTYQSTCPLKLFPPKGKRILGSMSGAYTMCRGNTGQYNFTVKVSKFNFILPESKA